MTEPGPVSFSLLAVAVAALGPIVGPWALIIFAAGVGAALALSVEKPASRWDGLKYLVVGTGVALLLTSPIVWAVTAYTEIPANVALVPVAFVLGAARNQLLSVIRQVLEAIAAAASAALQLAASLRGGGK